METWYAEVQILQSLAWVDTVAVRLAGKLEPPPNYWDQDNVKYMRFPSKEELLYTRQTYGKAKRSLESD